MNLEHRIDQLLAGHVRPDGPGAAIAVLRDGAFMHRKAYGLADLEWATPLRPDCVFRVASLTKQFTAVAVMMLHERGALSIDAPIERYLADWQPRGRCVTARHLLNHTSGLWVHDRAEAVRVLGPFPSVIDEVRLVCRREFAAEPGAVYRYNNSGYLLLGAIVERLSGLSFGDFLRRNIFEPLGMHRTGLLADEAIAQLRARGYVRGRSGYHNARPDLLDWRRAAGGLGSTLDDLALWDRAIRHDRLIRRETFEAMLAPAPLSDGMSYPYGLGWGLTEDYVGARIYHHAGGISGFTCQMLHLRDEDATTIVLSNFDLFPFDQVSRGLVRAIKDQPYRTPPLAELTSQHLATCGGRFVSADGGVFVISDNPALAALGDGRLCDPADPEVEYRFSEPDGGRFQRLDYITPLWPVSTYRRAG